MTHPHRVRRALLVFRSGEPGSEFHEVEFLRGDAGYVATVPARDVRHPGFGYAIELELLDGGRAPVFASRLAPFRVSVLEDLMDVRERIALARVGGRRSVVSSTFE